VAGRSVFPELQRSSTSLALPAHFLEDAFRGRLRQITSRSAAASGFISSTMSRAIRIDDSTMETCSWMDLFQRVRRHFSSRVSKTAHAPRVRVLHDVGNVGGVQSREPLVLDAQLDTARRVGLD